jgi:ABC-type sugar transport system ATPase subunit
VTEPAGAPVLAAEVVVVEPSERTLIATLRADGTEFKLKTQTGNTIRPGDRLQVRFDATKLYAFDPPTGLALARS